MTREFEDTDNDDWDGAIESIKTRPERKARAMRSEVNQAQSVTPDRDAAYMATVAQLQQERDTAMKQAAAERAKVGELRAQIEAWKDSFRLLANALREETL